MATTDATRIRAQVYALLGRPAAQDLPPKDIDVARINAGMEVLRAIASNPRNPHYAQLCTMVAIAHDSFLPDHDGHPGIPNIVPFDGAEPVAGHPARPDQIDAWRTEEVAYSGTDDGVAVPHDEADGNNRPSPVAGFYAIDNGRFKFTGFSAEIPLMQLTRLMADVAVPLFYEMAIIKLAAGSFMQFQQAVGLRTSGLEDLKEISTSSAPAISPIPDVTAAQKAKVA